MHKSKMLIILMLSISVLADDVVEFTTIKSYPDKSGIRTKTIYTREGVTNLIWDVKKVGDRTEASIHRIYYENKLVCVLDLIEQTRSITTEPNCPVGVHIYGTKGGVVEYVILSSQEHRERFFVDGFIQTNALFRPMTSSELEKLNLEEISFGADN